MIRNFIDNLKILPRWVIIFIDFFLICVSSLLGYLLRFNFSISELYKYHFIEGIVISGATGVVSIFITGSFKGIIRYTGIQDGVRIFSTVILNSIVLLVLNAVGNRFIVSVPFSVIVISGLASFLFLFNYRLLVKYTFHYFKRAIQKKYSILIFGAGRTGIITRKVVESMPRMKVVGFIEDDQNKVGKLVDGVRIFSSLESDFQELLETTNVNEVIFTSSTMSYERKNEVVDLCLKNQVKVRSVPPIEKWSKGGLNFNQIKEINIEDLLERNQIQIDNPAVSNELRAKKVLITGAAGSIGSELVRQAIKYLPELIILIDQSESALYDIEREIRKLGSGVKSMCFLADVSNKERMENIFSEYAPNFVYHAAAYKHVPVMESNPSESICCNIFGTKIVADLSVKYGADKFVMISTDKAVNPTNIMGCSKRIAEIYVQSLDHQLQLQGNHKTAFVTTRFGNVLGSNGSVIPIFKDQILNGGPVTVTHPEVTRYFMTIPEACQLVLEASIMGKGGEIFIFDMGKPIKIIDLAKKMVSLSGLSLGKDIDIVFTGLREGEKLYEELLNNSENTVPTHHERIMIARVERYNYTEVNSYIDLFNDLIYDRNELKMVALMKELVPEFKSNYSRFEVLDSVDKS